MSKHPQAQNVRQMRMEELRNSDAIVKQMAIELFSRIIEEFKNRPLVTMLWVDGEGGFFSIGGRETDISYVNSVLEDVRQMFNAEEGYYVRGDGDMPGYGIFMKKDPDLKAWYDEE